MMQQVSRGIDQLCVRLGQIKDRWDSVINYRWLIGLGGPAMLAVAVAGWQYWHSQPDVNYKVLSVESQSIKEATSSAALKSVDSAEDKIVVDVSGAVLSPGIKELRKVARVADALAAAGGFSDEADQEYVGQLLNLAQTLEDGDKLYIPTVQQVLASLPTPIPLVAKNNQSVSLLSKPSTSATPKPLASSSPSPIPSGTNSSPTPGSMVNVNQASELELDALPGIGQATATKIVQGRPYQTLDSLCAVINNSKTCSGLEGLVSF